MSRIIITTTDDETGRTTTEGWFDPRRAEQFSAATYWDGQNRASVVTRSEWIDEWLYRTPGGRWVLNRDATRYNGGADVYRFISDDEARDWLTRSECNDEALERFFGPVADESGPNLGGRPPMEGQRVQAKLPTDLLAQVDAAAEATGVTRAEWIRRACTAALDSAAAAR